MRSKAIVAAIAIACMSAVAFAQNITFDFDRSANFGKFKTYTWVRGTNVADELNHKRVTRAIETQLAAKGLSPVQATENPDLLVAYHATFDNDIQINGFSSGFGPYRFGGTRSGTAIVDEILVGTLAVDLVDASSKTIVWRGVAVKEVNVKANADKRDKNINKAAEKLFRHYPPKAHS